MPPTTEKSIVAQRYRRYRPIIDFISMRARFSLSEIKQHFRDENPALITRSVNELIEQGWVIQEADSTDNFFWNSSRGSFSATRWLDEKLFGSQIKTTPRDERPRERLLRQGAEQLRTSELLAILIRSGRPGESAVMAGQKIATQFQNRMEDLATAGRGELKSLSAAVADAAYCQIMAGIELGRRISALTEQRVIRRISSTAAAIDFCQKHFARLATDARQEEFHIITLDTKNQIIDTHQITIGTLDASLVHPREVFRAAIKDAAASIILVHNHPSGDPTPSPQDHAVTRRLETAGQTLGIEVLDHIVLGKSNAVSIRDT